MITVGDLCQWVERMVKINCNCIFYIIDTHFRMSCLLLSGHLIRLPFIPSLLPGPTSSGIFFLEIPSELGAHCVFLFLFFLTGDVIDI